MILRLSPAQIVLAGICGLLGAILLYMFLAPLPEYTVATPKPPALPADTVAPARFEPPPAEAFAIVDNRSVFNPLRTKIVAPAAPNGAAATGLPTDLTLVGVILDGNTRIAMIKSPSAPMAVGVAVGSSFQGWQVTRVDPDRVALRGSGEEQELKMTAGKPGAPTQPTPVPIPVQNQAQQDSSDNE
jgi:hypothetical protein